jgi:Ca2+-binding RTX toxin-like protein
VASQANIDAIATLSSGFTGSSLKADTGTLNLSSKNVFGSADVQDSDGTSLAPLGEQSTKNMAQIIIDINAMIGAEDGSGADTINEMLVKMGESPEPLAVVEDYALMVDKMGDSAHDSVLLGRDGVQNFIAGGMGSDVLTGGQGATNFIYGGMKGTSAGIASTQIKGGDQRDFVAGSEDIDIIHGGSGNDFIDGGDGDDIIHGEAGTNFIHAGKGADTVYVDTAGFIAIDNNDGPADVDTIVLNARAVGTSHVVGFGNEDALSFTEADFISGNAGGKTLLGTGSSTSKFDLNTTDFSGIAAIEDNAVSDFSDAGSIIGAAVTNVAANDAFVFAVDNGSDTAIISWKDDGNGTFDSNDDVSLDVILVGVADAAALTMDNFALQA